MIEGWAIWQLPYYHKIRYVPLYAVHCTIFLAARFMLNSSVAWFKYIWIKFQYPATKRNTTYVECPLPYCPPILKELYTSISNLAQKFVLTLLNNKFILKILNSTQFGRKIRKQFRPKNHKSQFSAEVSSFKAFLYNIKKFHIFQFYTFLWLYIKTLGPLKRHLFLQIFSAKNQISAFRVLLRFRCIITKICD